MPHSPPRQACIAHKKHTFYKGPPVVAIPGRGIDMGYDIDYRAAKRRNRHRRGLLLTSLALLGCCAARILQPQALENLRRVLFPAQAIAAFAQSLLPQ